jgi:hypothetical protein
MQVLMDSYLRSPLPVNPITFAFPKTNLSDDLNAYRSAIVCVNDLYCGQVGTGRVEVVVED